MNCAFIGKKLRPFFLLLAAALVLLWPEAARAQYAGAEQEIKAGFIYNFALFVEWPAAAFKAPASPLTVCIAGDRETLKAFEQLKTKNIKERPISVCQQDAAATGGPCHIVYITAKEKPAAAELLNRVSGPGVLTIGDAEAFSRLGGIIGFYRVDNKLRFEINVDAAQRAGLKLSSQLLKLAKIVTDQEPSR